MVQRVPPWRRYGMPDILKHVSRHRDRVLRCQAVGLEQAERALRAQVGADATLAASRLEVSVRPRLRSVHALYVRAKKLLQEKMPCVPVDKFAEKQVCSLLPDEVAVCATLTRENPTSSTVTFKLKVCSMGAVLEL
jgi:hypothetical protein